mgnify:CR=1 FL=1
MMNATEQTMEQFKTWEEMSVLEQYACTYWDMYKDAHGVRPRGIDTSSWTEQDFEREFEYLQQVIDQEAKIAFRVKLRGLRCPARFVEKGMFIGGHGTGLLQLPHPDKQKSLFLLDRVASYQIGRAHV